MDSFRSYPQVNIRKDFSIISVQKGHKSTQRYAAMRGITQKGNSYGLSIIR